MTIFADQYGSNLDFSQALVNAINDLNNGDTISFSKKEYHFYKEKCQSRVIHMTNTDSFKNKLKYFAILFENLENILIDGNGATFVIHGDICSLALLNCKNVKLRNFTIKYARPQDVELKVLKCNGFKATFELFQSDLWHTDGKNVYFYDESPFTHKKYWQFKNGDNTWCSVLHSGNSVKRTIHQKSPLCFVKSANKTNNNLLEIKYFKPRKFKVGDIYAYSQNKNRNTCGIFFNECENVDSENMRVMYLQGFGWLSQMCKDMSFSNITFKADENSVVTSFADLIHICGCKGRVNINNCYFAHAHDDAINIHGSFVRLKEIIDDKTAVFEFVHNQQGGHRAFFKGDKARFYFRHSLSQIDGEYTVKSATDHIDDKFVTVEFEESLPKEISSKYLGQNNVVAENITYCPSVDIYGNEFDAIPTRGVLCTTCNEVKIHNNKFSNLNMAHVFVSNDAADWFESGPVRDMKIYDNEFDLTSPNKRKNCALLVEPITLSKQNKSYVHRNISFFNNKIITGKNKVVIASCVDNLQIYNNEIIGKEKYKFNYCKTKMSE